FEVEGMATAIPFHRAVVADPDFTAEPFRIHTRWIETEFNNTIQPFTGAGGQDGQAEEERRTVVVEVGGKRLEVSLPSSLGGAAAPGGARPRPRPRRETARRSPSAASGDAVVSPMQGTVVKVAVADGDQVAEGDLVVVVEAMKMEQPINAHRAGTVKDLAVTAGAAVTSGFVLCEIKD
ncbi:biotin/lipoyl-containing protein, partial [Streptomyces orinoci]